MNADQVIMERRNTHGPFQSQFQFAQSLKVFLRDQPKWGELSSVQREVMEMLATKMSRLLHGDNNEADHWRDIAGYARLAEMELLALSDQAHALQEDPAQVTDALTEMQENEKAVNELVNLVRQPHPLDERRYVDPIGPSRPSLAMRELPPAYLDRRGVPNKEDLGVDLAKIDEEIRDELRRA